MVRNGNVAINEAIGGPGVHKCREDAINDLRQPSSAVRSVESDLDLDDGARGYQNIRVARMPALNAHASVAGFMCCI